MTQCQRAAVPQGRSARTHGCQRVPARLLVLLALLGSSCREAPPADRVLAAGYVEAEEIQLSAEVGGRLLELHAREGDVVRAGDVVARLDTRDTELALARARAERRQADAQLRLLLAGAAPEELSQADAQAASLEAELDLARDELAAAGRDFERFDALLRSNAASQKQRDDAATRRDTAQKRVQSLEQRLQAARAAAARLRSGARREEIEAARARVATADASIAVLEKALADAAVKAPAGGTVTEQLVDVGEIVQPRAPLLVIARLEEVWANVYVGEPVVPRLKLGQVATVRTDAGSTLAGRVTFVSPKAEFTPRNVQTAEERAKLVYRVKVTVKNERGILKAGMPVEAEIRLP